MLPRGWEGTRSVQSKEEPGFPSISLGWSQDNRGQRSVGGCPHLANCPDAGEKEEGEIDEIPTGVSEGSTEIRENHQLFISSTSAEVKGCLCGGCGRGNCGSPGREPSSIKPDKNGLQLEELGSSVPACWKCSCFSPCCSFGGGGGGWNRSPFASPLWKASKRLQILHSPPPPMFGTNSLTS